LKTPKGVQSVNQKASKPAASDSIILTRWRIGRRSLAGCIAGSAAMINTGDPFEQLGREEAPRTSRRNNALRQARSQGASSENRRADEAQRTRTEARQHSKQFPGYLRANREELKALLKAHKASAGAN